MSDLNEWRMTQIEDFRKYKKDNPTHYHPICILKGCRGRSMTVYEDRVLISTTVTAGSLLTSNATDGDKIIYYHDVVGIQFKKPGATIGYLQLETSSGQMNNLTSNFFSENTFTYDKLTDAISETVEFIEYKISQHKH